MELGESLGQFDSKEKNTKDILESLSGLSYYYRIPVCLKNYTM